ncbi:MAG TPA: DUF192 domain-containing protein [Steroidobacteraceae bacterium]|nr:DUF192 domain-containing protein [Steroidobacteraceae bacterium]
MTGRTIGRRARILAAASLSFVLTQPLADAFAPEKIVPLSAFPRELIAIETRASFRRQLFEAWRAESWAARAQGLMFVEDAQMRPDQAMIFVYQPPQYVAMWMKNTLISLDMLFVDAKGCIVTVRERAQPHSLATISSRFPVVLVVELRAGTVAERGIRVGDRVLRLDAGWPGDAGKCRAGP